MGLDFSKYTLALDMGPNVVRVIVTEAHNRYLHNDCSLIKFRGAAKGTRHAGDIIVSRNSVNHRSQMRDASNPTGYAQDERTLRERLEYMGFDLPGTENIPYTDRYLWSPFTNRVNLANSVIDTDLRRSRFKLELNQSQGNAVVLLAGHPILGVSEDGFTPYVGYYSESEGFYIMSKQRHFKDSFGNEINYAV